MKPFFKYKRNLIALIIFLASFLLPLVAFMGDVIAYCMGYHHGFTQPWPTIQNVLYVSFATIFLGFIIYIVIAVVIYTRANKKETKDEEKVGF